MCRQCRLCRENTNTWNLEQTKAIFILAVPSTVVRRVGGVRQTVASRTEASARTFFFGESTGCEFAGAAVAMVDCNFLYVYANSYEMLFRSTLNFPARNSFFFRIDNLRNEIMGDGFGNGFDKLTTDSGEGWQIALALQAVVFLLSGFVLATIVS